MTGRHDPRCEWSRTPPTRCRCACEGREHGVRRVRQQLAVLAGFKRIGEAEENEQ